MFTRLFLRIRLNPYLVLSLFVALIAAWPLMSQSGLLNTRGGGDSPFLLQRLQQLETAVLDGHFPVRWMPDANYGYGYPFYNFYAPLSIYITAVFRLIGFSYVRSIQLSQLAGFLVAAWGMFQLGRRWWQSEAAGMITAVAYTLAPFHLVNIYTRGDSLAEFWAMAFYPLVILTADNLLVGEKRPTPHILLFALSYAALILSHNISALIFSPFLGLFILWRWWGWRGRQGQDLNVGQDNTRLPHPYKVRSLIMVFLALLLALALSAWFFLPALLEQPLAQLGPVTEGYFHYSNHFRGTNLIQSSFFFDFDPDGGEAFRMGLVQTVTAVLALLTYLYYRLHPHPLTPTPLSLASLLIPLMATFMLTPLSRFLWDNLPLLPFTQFPWRFLSVQAFGLALLLGVLAMLPWRNWIVGGTAVLLLLSTLGNLHTDHLILTDADVTAERLAQYEWFTGNIGTTVSAEYLPPTVQPRPSTSQWLTSGNRWQLIVLDGELTNSLLVTKWATRQKWLIETADHTTLIFPTLYWPGWQAQIDDQSADITPSPGSGLIMLDVPTGSHAIELRLTRTPVRLIAEWVSLTAVLLLIGFAIYTARPTRYTLRPALYALLAITPLTIFLHLWPKPELPDNNLTWDFAQMGYLNHAPIQFDKGGEIVGVETAVTDQTLTLNLDWDGSSDTIHINLYTPAIHRYPDAPAIASLGQSLQPGANQFTIPIPNDAPTGLIVPQISIGDLRPIMPSGRTRGPLFLQPVRLDGVVKTADLPSLNARLTPTEVKDGLLIIPLDWYTPHPLSQNYNFSLRLIDDDGLEVAQLDGQPGYGFQPSSGWPVGQWVNDRLAIPWPAGVSDASLVVRLYDVSTQEVVLMRYLGQRVNDWFVPHTPGFVLPFGIEKVTAVFAPAAADNVIELHGYELEQTAAALHLTLYWQALVDGQTDYTRFVHLIDSQQNGVPLAQNDGVPRHNTFPTSQWSRGEIIADDLTLPLTEIPAGDYQIVVGFYEKIGDTFVRLTAVKPLNTPLPFDRAPLPETIMVEP